MKGGKHLGNPEQTPGGICDCKHQASLPTLMKSEEVFACCQRQLSGLMEPLLATNSHAGRETLSAGEGCMLDFIILRDRTAQN